MSPTTLQLEGSADDSIGLEIAGDFRRYTGFRMSEAFSLYLGRSGQDMDTVRP